MRRVERAVATVEGEVETSHARDLDEQNGMDETHPHGM